MNIEQIVNQLKQNKVVAYPTEAVFGLGCHPLSEQAVQALLTLKKRPIEKGLILIAPHLDFLLPYIDTSALKDVDFANLKENIHHPTTWIVPAKKSTPHYLTGQFSTIAVRICTHDAVKALCEKTGFALVSTSANLSGLEPSKTANDVRKQFGEDFPVLDMNVGHAQKPSEIRDLLTNKIFRQG